MLIEARYDYEADKCRCPACKGIGVPWGGWFTCDDCLAVAVMADGRCFVLADEETDMSDSGEDNDKRPMSGWATTIYSDAASSDAGARWPVLVFPSPEERDGIRVRVEKAEAQLAERERQIDRAVACLVCFPIADPSEVWENTMDILDPGWREKKDEEPADD